MDREEKNKKVGSPAEREFVLQWGKRLRCVRGKSPNVSSKLNGGIRRRTASLFISASGTELSQPQPNGSVRLSETQNFTPPLIDGRKSVSPDKEERYYTTRGSLAGGGGGCAVDENRKSVMGVGGEEKGGGDGEFVWPRLCISLSSKEKEEDFLAMKGCKPPHRPKKRAKLVQRTLLLVSPGEWLSDLCQERYEVRERKTSKKAQRPKGLKSMGALESDSE
ncbi:hypothetical protein V2J09_008645 [Rumex salicifolius]